MRNEIDCCNNQTLLIWLANNLILLNGIELLYLFFISLVNRSENMSHMMCHDHLVGSQTFDGSRIHFRVCV